MLPQRPLPPTPITGNNFRCPPMLQNPFTMDELDRFVGWFEDPANLAMLTKGLRLPKSQWIGRLATLFPNRTTQEVEDQFGIYKKAFLRARMLNAGQDWGLRASDDPQEKKEQRGMCSGDDGKGTGDG